MNSPVTSSGLKVHIVNTHMTYPNWSEGALNDALAERAKNHLISRGHDVTETKVEDFYDPELEVQRHVEANLVILQTPINWFGAPWIYKRYVDEVFNAGLHSNIFQTGDGRTRSDPTRQYGTGGHMQGRGFFVSSTWSAPSATFDNPDSIMFGGKSSDDVLLSLTTSYKFVGFTLLENYGVYDFFHTAGAAAAGVEDFAAHLDNQVAAMASIVTPISALA